MNKKTNVFFVCLTAGLIGAMASLLMISFIFKHMPNVTNAISGIYLFCALVGYTGLIWFFISTLSYLLTKVTKSFIPASVLISLSLLLLFLDTRVYAVYRSHLSKGLLEYAINEAFSELQRVGSAGIIPFTVVIIVLTFCINLLLKFINKKGESAPLYLSKYFYIAFFAMFTLSQLTYMYVDVINYIPIKKWTRHIPLYQPLTARRAMFKYGIVDSSKVRDFEINAVTDDTSINYPKDLKCENNPSVKPNILWLFLDTWRFDAYNKEATPQIHDWVSKNNPHIFNNHWSVGNETIPSLFAMFYGVPGLYIKSFTESGTTPIFISKLLKENYQLQISTGWPLDNTSLTKNVFREVPNLRVSIGDKEAWESDVSMKTEIFDFLKKRDTDRPFFSFMIFDSAHDYSLPKDYNAPFKPFAEKLNYLALNPSTDPKPYRNKYNNSIHYIDSIVGDILKSPLIKDSKRPTVILVASDHGEQFNDLKKNFWGHSSNFSRYQLRVPLFIKWDGVKVKAQNTQKDISHMTTHNDLSHTFLESVFGCTPSPQQSVGKNLYDTTDRLPLLLSTYSRHGVLTKDRVYSYEIGQGYEVFDYDYNEVEVNEIPKSIFNQYLKASSKFYN